MGQQTFQIFEGHIANQVPTMNLVLGCIQAIFCFPGLLLISHNTTQEQQQLAVAQANEEESMLEQQHVQEEEQQEQPQQVHSTLPQLSCSEYSQLTARQCIATRPFLVIYAATILISCPWLFILANFKTYGLTKINDDYFLTFLLIFCTLLGSITNILWGHLSDRIGFTVVFRWLIVVYLTSFVLFPLLNSSKIGFFLTFEILGMSYKGITTILSPGLVNIYGLHTGAELIPYQGTTMVISYGLLPLMQMLLTWLSVEQIIFVVLIGTAVSFGLVCMIKDEESKPRYSQKSTGEGNATEDENKDFNDAKNKKIEEMEL